MDNIGFTVLIYGCLILVALLMTRLTRLLHFPNVTAYLLGGLIIGPSLMLIIYRLFAGSGSAPTLFLSQYATAIGNLGIICDIALAFIALSIGGEFKTSEIKKMGKRIVIIGLFEALTATILVTGILLALHNVLNISVGICLTLGAIAAATAPAATLLVVKQYKAKGPVVSTLLPIVALDDAIGLIIFSISYSIAGVYELGVGISIFSVLVNPLVEILVSLGLGVLIGIVLTQMSKLFKSRANALGLMVGVALISVAIAKINFHFGPVSFQISSLLMCMMIGATYINMKHDSEKYLQRVDEFTSPLFLSFFVISGASIDLSVLAQVSILLVALLYLLTRAAGKYCGASIGAIVTHCEPDVKKYLGITLLPQAGVAIGMAGLAQTRFASTGSGTIIYTIVLCSTLVYELLGPILTKWALEKAHEINKEQEIVVTKKNKHKHGKIQSPSI